MQGDSVSIIRTIPSLLYGRTTPDCCVNHMKRTAVCEQNAEFSKAKTIF